MRLWSATTGQLLRTLVGHSGLALRCAFPPDGQTILSTSVDGKVVLWEAATAQLLRIAHGHSSVASACGFSPDGNSIVAGFADGVVKMWR